MTSHKDFFFKKAAIQTNYLSEEKVNLLLKIQKELEQEGIKSDLEEIAVKEKAIDKEQLKVIQKQIVNEMNLGATKELPTMNRSLRNLDKKFLHYEILEEIAHSSLEKTYKARNTKNGNRVAIKEFSNQENIGKIEIESFFQELEKCKVLDNAHIERIYDVYDKHDPPFFVVELIDGRSFDSVKEKLSHIRIIEIIHKLSESLHYAHQENIYHHDLTPSNIYLDEFGEPVITNFALAKTIITSGGISISGTPSYMSPEQATGIQKKVDGQSNIFSLGIVFYEALTSKLPFLGKNTDDIIAKIQTETPASLRSINEDISEDIEYICLKALQKDRNKRYFSAQEMAAHLELYLEGKPIEKEEVKQKKSLLWIIILVIVLGIIIIIKMIFS